MKNKCIQCGECCKKLYLWDRLVLSIHFKTIQLSKTCKFLFNNRCKKQTTKGKLCKEWKCGVSFVILFFFLFSTSLQAYKFDLDALMSYQRGNTVNTVMGSNTSLKTDRISTSALYLYSDNDVKIDRQYEAKGTADYPLFGQLEAFTFAVFGMDSKKHLDNYNKEVIGLSYKMFNVKYSVGLGRNQENAEHVFIKTHRLKTDYENESYKFAAVAWYIQNPDDYDISINASLKRKLTKILRVGLSVEYTYDSSPIGDSVRGDFLSKFIVGISL